MAEERGWQRHPLLFHATRAAHLHRAQRRRTLNSRDDRATHVLVVEDSSLVTDALRVLFEETGYSVAIAASVREASEEIAARPPDVVFLDLVLPDGDGLSLMPSLSGATVFALTGHSDTTTKQRCLAAGCRDVLIKPVSVAELLRRVREARG